MNTSRSCGCKGYRTCLFCEALFNIKLEQPHKPHEKTVVYCPWCNLCYSESANTHPTHPKTAYQFPGIYIKLDFLSEEEHNSLIKTIDGMPWNPSQSGRRKQNFGPKCNFNGRKMRLGDFGGFPEGTKFIQNKFHEVPVLENFQTIEQCSLEYDPQRGASIEPHVDDCWVWGERVVTVNLLSDSVLTLTPNRYPHKYNLNLVPTYPSVVEQSFNLKNDLKDETVLVPMPKNSLLVMFGAARYEYEHRIFREDIRERRVCLAYREFTPIFLDGGKCEEEGRAVIEKAKVFFGGNKQVEC